MFIRVTRSGPRLGVQLLLCVCILAAGLASSASAGVPLHVTTDADNVPGSLRAVIDAAPNDATVVIDPGKNPVLSSGQITIDKTLTIEGQGVGSTTIDANDASRIFNIDDPGTIGVIIRDVTLEDGRAPSDTPAFDLINDGGAIRNTEILTIESSRITGSAAGNGRAGTDGNIPSGNAGNATAGGTGGALATTGPTLIFDSTIDNNDGGDGGDGGTGGEGISPGSDGGEGGDGGGGGAGGGVAGSGLTSIMRSTLVDNDAGPGGIGGDGGDGGGGGDAGAGGDAGDGGGGGGAAFDVASLPRSVSNSTVHSNTDGGGSRGGEGVPPGNDSDGGSGGGLFFAAGDFGSIDSSTITENVASTEGGGIAGELSIRSSIVADNSVGPGIPDQCFGPVTDSGHNIQFSGSGGDCPATFLFANPLLGDLADNGGPTETQALGQASPAVDKGSPPDDGCPPTDQRGISRPQGAALRHRRVRGRMRHPQRPAWLPAGTRRCGSAPRGPGRECPGGGREEVQEGPQAEEGEVREEEAQEVARPLAVS